jgi:hypothetical protein
MNSSIIMFSNMFSNKHFYKHGKPYSSLQCSVGIARYVCSAACRGTVRRFGREDMHSSIDKMT